MDSGNPPNGKQSRAKSATSGSQTGDNGRAHASGGHDHDNRSTSTQESALPTLGLPKGGGAIRGIGDKFAANPVTGAGKVTIPLRWRMATFTCPISV
jgi:hypothetical protein